MRDLSGASWRLKLARAEEHFQQLKAHLGAYVCGDVYGVRRVHRREVNPYVWTYALDVREQPDSKASLIFGDVLHNLRSGLDHLAVAISEPGGQASFPIETESIWATDADGEFIHKDEEARKRYRKSVKGMSKEAIAVIEEMQPYVVRHTAPLVGIDVDDQPELHPLRILGLLNNTDKHRDLVRLSFMLKNALSFMYVRGEMVGLWTVGDCYDGTEVAHHPFPPRENPEESEVEVRVFGTPNVTVPIGIKGGNTPVFSALRFILDRMPIEVFDALEPHVRD